MKDLLLIAQKAIGILRLYWFTLAPVSQKKWKRSEVDTKYTVGLCYSWVTLSLGNPSSLSDSPGKPTQALPWRKTLSLLYWREISLFCILQYISNISTMKHSWVQQGQEVDNIFQRPKLPGMRLGGAAGTATLDHLLHLVHKRGPISAFERVFPSLAPQRSAALPACTAPSAFQPRHLLGRLASGVALLLLVIISYPFPSTRDF